MNRLLLVLILFPTLVYTQKELRQIQPQQIQKNSFVLQWESGIDGIAAVQYGLTPLLELDWQQATTKSHQQHQIQLSNLQPATFYYAQPLLINGSDTVRGAVGYYSTQSSSTGVIRVMFNQGIDPLYSDGGVPHISTGGANIENEIISMINQATSTIDIAVFNTTRSGIVAALTTAHNNGIRVRFIANSGTLTSNAALSNPSPPFPVFYANASDLMHNKFMVIDVDSVNNSWVWTGSCNWTYTDMYTNYNNSIAIQDQALAQAYVLEFNEMWGSTGASFNASVSKVGAQKTNNTPHNFNIGGKMIESYFSPSDNTTDEIESSLYSANYDLEFCLLSYTRNELGTAVRNQHQAGVLEHGIMENIADFGSEYNWLVSQGVNILADNHATALHHKYAIVDAGNISSDPQVVTGSHNWTTAAEDRNDENTLIIHDANIANLYLQEFTLRWCEVKGSATCALPFTVYSGVDVITNEEERKITLYPNPTASWLSLELDQSFEEVLTAKLYSTTGQHLRTYSLAAQETMHQLNLSDLENGLYFLMLEANGEVWRKPISVVR